MSPRGHCPLYGTLPPLIPQGGGALLLPWRGWPLRVHAPRVRGPRPRRGGADALLRVLALRAGAVLLLRPHGPWRPLRPSYGVRVLDWRKRCHPPYYPCHHLCRLHPIWEPSRACAWFPQQPFSCVHAKSSGSRVRCGRRQIVRVVFFRLDRSCVFLVLPNGLAVVQAGFGPQPLQLCCFLYNTIAESASRQRAMYHSFSPECQT